MPFKCEKPSRGSAQRSLGAAANYARSLIARGRRAVFSGFCFLLPASVAFASEQEPALQLTSLQEDDALSMLSFNVYGHPLFAAFQRPERFARISQAFRRDFAQTMFIALQESHVPKTEILGRGYVHQVEGACGAANGFRPTGLRLLSRQNPRKNIERYVFEENTAGGVELLPEEKVDCTRLREHQQTRKGFLAVPFVVQGQNLLVVNLHLSPSRRRREQEKALLFSWLAQKPASWSVVMAGDFNEDLCAQRLVQRTWERQRLQNLSCSVGATVGGWRKGIWQGAFFGGQIDHILYRGPYRGGERRRVFHKAENGLHFSDHDGVWGRWIPAS